MKQDFCIPLFKRNNEELKANIARIDKGKQSDVNAEVFKPMSKTPPRLNKNFEFVPTCHHCHIVGNIRPNCPKLSTPKVRLHVCHHCGVSGHIHSNFFKLYSQKCLNGHRFPLKDLYLCLESY